MREDKRGGKEGGMEKNTKEVRWERRNQGVRRIRREGMREGIKGRRREVKKE